MDIIFGSWLNFDELWLSSMHPLYLTPPDIMMMWFFVICKIIRQQNGNSLNNYLHGSFVWCFFCSPVVVWLRSRHKYESLSPHHTILLNEIHFCWANIDSENRSNSSNYTVDAACCCCCFCYLGNLLYRLSLLWHHRHLSFWDWNWVCVCSLVNRRTRMNDRR